MDIGREVRRYRAEPIESPVPGEAPARHEPAPRQPAPALREPDVDTVTDDAREVATEARA